MDNYSPKIIDLSSTDVETILNRLSLFNCDIYNKECKQTIGYVRDKLQNYYSININPDENISTKMITCKSSDIKSIGGLSAPNYELCIKSNNNDLDVILGNWSDNIYVLNIPDSNETIFKDYISENIIIRSSNDIIYHDNVYEEAGINLFIFNSLVYDTNNISDDTIKVSGLYICNINGICESVDGYIKNESYYYYLNAEDPSENSKMLSNNSNQNQNINKRSTSNLNNYVSDCSSYENIGGLLETGEICISPSKSVPFVDVETDEGNYKFIDGNYLLYDHNENEKIVRSIPNIFVKQKIDGK